MQKKIISLDFSDGEKILAEIYRRLGSQNLADRLSGAALYIQSAMPQDRAAIISDFLDFLENDRFLAPDAKLQFIHVLAKNIQQSKEWYQSHYPQMPSNDPNDLKNLDSDNSLKSKIMLITKSLKLGMDIQKVMGCILEDPIISKEDAAISMWQNIGGLEWKEKERILEMLLNEFPVSKDTPFDRTDTEARDVFLAYVLNKDHIRVDENPFQTVRTFFDEKLNNPTTSLQFLMGIPSISKIYLAKNILHQTKKDDNTLKTLLEFFPVDSENVEECEEQTKERNGFLYNIWLLRPNEKNDKCNRKR